MDEPLIEHGFATLAAGTWLIGRGQPAAVCGAWTLTGIRGLFAPDRRDLSVLTTEQTAHLADAARPFLTHLTSVGNLTVVSAKLLTAPLAARSGSKFLRVIPMSLREAFPVTHLVSDWVVMATKSRIRRITLQEGEILCVKREAVVAWNGKDPVGVAGRIRLRDLVIPKRKPSLSLDFYGPQVVWVEGINGI